MPPEVICLDSSPVAPPRAPVASPVRRQAPNKSLKRPASISNYNSLFDEDDFDTTGDLSFSSNKPPPSKKPRVTSTSRPDIYPSTTASRVPPKTARLDPIEFSSPHPSGFRHTKTHASIDSFSGPPAVKEDKSQVPYSILSDDDWDFYLPATKPHGKSQPKQQPVGWDPISSSLPKAVTNRSPLTARHANFGYDKSTNSAMQGSINIDDPSDSSNDEEFPDLDSLKFRTRTKPLSRPIIRSTSDIIAGLATSKSRKPSSTKPLPKAKLTTEEREKARNEKAVAREAERSRKAEARANSLEQRKREKEQEAALAAVNKVRIDKKETVKQMIVDLPESMAPTFLLQTQTLLKEAGAENTTWMCSVPNVVRWRRKVKARYSDQTKRFEPIPETVEVERHILILMTAPEFIDLVQEGECQDLDAHVLKVKSQFPNREIIYLLEGLAQWLRKNRNKMNREFAAQVRQQFDGDSSSKSKAVRESRPPTMDEDGMEDALLNLQVVHDVKIHHTGAPVESAQWIAIFTQHVSTIPWKRIELDGPDAGFCMDSGQVRSGEDAKGAYVRMLEEVTRITKPIAWGVVNEFENVTKLVKGVEEGGPLRLEDVRKATGRQGELSDDRTIGQAVSKRLWKFFTSRDPGSSDV